MEFYLMLILKLFIGFVIVIGHMNLSGKTQLSQLTPIDFIGNFILGGVIGGVIYNPDIPLHQYIILLFIGVLIISFLNYLTKRFNIFRNVAIGEPILLIKNGKFQMENIKNQKNKIDILSISSRLHGMGIRSFGDIFYAQVETDGSITVFTDEAKMPSIILMVNTEEREPELEEIGKDKDWLEQQIEKCGIKKKEDIFIAEYYDGIVHFVLKDGSVIKNKEYKNDDQKKDKDSKEKE